MSDVDGVRRLAGLDVRVRVQGSGPPVLLLGGCGVPAELWAPVVERLPGATVVRLERAGGGGTRWPGRLPDLAGEVAVLAALLAELDGPAVVAAHSMAGPHAEALTRLHPDLVARLVLVDSSVARDRPRPHPAVVGAGWLALARLARRLLRLAPARRLAAEVGWLGSARQTRVRAAAVRDARPPGLVRPGGRGGRRRRAVGRGRPAGRARRRPRPGALARHPRRRADRGR